MNDLLFSSWGGQVVDNRGKAAQAFKAAEQAPLPEYFKQDERIKALIGWYGIVLRSGDVNVVDLCREYMAEVHNASCGKCIPCRTGTGIMAGILNRFCDGSGQPQDLDRLRTLSRTVSATAKCSIGQTGPIAILHALEHFPGAFQAALSSRTGIAKGAYRSCMTAPCMDACPIHLDIPAYVESIREGKFKASLDTIRARLPLPGIVGRVCVRPCEAHCRRTNLDAPISIKYLKRFVADSVD